MLMVSMGQRGDAAVRPLHLTLLHFLVLLKFSFLDDFVPESSDGEVVDDLDKAEHAGSDKQSCRPAD